MGRLIRIIVIAVVGLASIPAVFFLSCHFLWKMVEEEYTSGARTSTGGDTVTIPAVGLTVAWTLLLLVATVVVVVVSTIRRRRRLKGL
jgi:hypothetical protein